MMMIEKRTTCGLVCCALSDSTSEVNGKPQRKSRKLAPIDGWGDVVSGSLFQVKPAPLPVKRSNISNVHEL
jgi:hypothetical protein